ncbi:DsrE/DsrF/DrsH-like family protein [Staphylococcus pseudintermedius]|uniref:DsrE/DsrF/DrsH-like family protein n=1 Tax=Staphylococcus pseudintermedius TaxID=283734 RepID=UPI0035206C8A
MLNFSELEIKSLKKDELERLGELGQLIDVRTDEEYQEGHIRGAKSWPLDQIELFKGDKNQTYYLYCRSGKRSAQASSALAKRGYNVVSLDGGFVAYSEEVEAHRTEDIIINESVPLKEERQKIDLSGLQCPGPILNVSKAMQNMSEGEQIEVNVSDFGFYSDVQSWVKQTGHQLIRLNQDNQGVHAVLQKSNAPANTQSKKGNGTTIVLFSGDLDKAIAAMIIANGAKAAGRDVSVFFTFWGLNALKKTIQRETQVNKKGIAKMFDWMLPKQPEKMPISKFNMFGLGNFMMRYVMRQKNIDTLPQLINQAIEQDIKLIACTMSMDVMGITKEELRDEVTFGGVGTYIGDTENARHNLFI